MVLTGVVTWESVMKIWTMLSRFRSQAERRSTNASTRCDSDHKLQTRDCSFSPVNNMPHISVADLELLTAYLSRDQDLSQDLQDVVARLRFSSTLESLDGGFGLPTPQPVVGGAMYEVGSQHFFRKLLSSITLFSSV